MGHEGTISRTDFVDRRLTAKSGMSSHEKNNRKAAVDVLR